MTPERIIEPEEIFRCVVTSGKQHVTAATDTHATMEEIFGSGSFY
jgi:hypothetical protein